MSPIKKLITTSLIFTIITLVLIVFFIYPLFQKIKRNSEDLISAKKELISLQAKIENLEKLKELYLTLQPGLEKIDALFIDPKAPIDFIKFLEKIGGDSGVLIDISYIGVRKIETDPWPSLGFQIALTGPFPNCLKFLERIETSPYLIEVQNLDIRRIAKEEVARFKEGVSAGNVEATLSIKVFTKPY